MLSPSQFSVEPCGTSCACEPGSFHLLIPDYDEGIAEESQYPGDILPGKYNWDSVVLLLRQHKGSADAVQFVADMLEE